MSRLAPTCLAVLLGVAVSLRASAQPSPVDTDDELGEPGAGLSSPVDTAEVVPEPPRAADKDPSIPDVTDPMLAPVPPPRLVLGSWQDALRLVRSRNSSLRMAAAQVQQATGQSRQALALALPTLTGTANVTRHLLTGEGFRASTEGFERGRIPDPLTTWNAGLTARVPVLAPRAWHDRRTARHAVGTAELKTEDAQRIVLASTAESIVSVVTAERMAEVSRVSLRSALVTLDLNRRRARLGAASAFDVLRAEQEVAASRAQVVAADEALRLSREALGLALGSAEAYGVPPTIDLNGLASDAAASCRVEPSVASRPDVRAAQQNVEVAERNVQASNWDYYPTVDALSTATYWGDEKRTANGKHVTWTIGATLTWQLYDGGLRYGRRDANQGTLDLAREQLTQTKRQAEVEVVQARRSVQVAEANLAVSKQTRDLAQQSARLARLAFVSGTGTSFDLVDAARRLREAELDLAVKEFEVVRAKILAMLALASCDV